MSKMINDDEIRKYLEHDCPLSNNTGNIMKFIYV